MHIENPDDADRVMNIQWVEEERRPLSQKIRNAIIVAAVAFLTFKTAQKMRNKVMKRGQPKNS